MKELTEIYQDARATGAVLSQLVHKIQTSKTLPNSDLFFSRDRTTHESVYATEYSTENFSKFYIIPKPCIQNTGLSFSSMPSMHGEERFLYSLHSDRMADTTHLSGGANVNERFVPVFGTVLLQHEEWMFQKSLIHDESELFMLVLISYLQHLQIPSFMMDFDKFHAWLTYMNISSRNSTVIMDKFMGYLYDFKKRCNNEKVQ